MEEFPRISIVRNRNAQLDSFNENDARKFVRNFSKKLSPGGNHRFFGNSGDRTCQGKAIKQEAWMIVARDNYFTDNNNPWKLVPSFYVTSTARPASSNSNANSKYVLPGLDP